MTSIITELRQMTNTSPSDYTINGVDYWTDDQIQDIADRSRNIVRGLRLKTMPTYINGSYQYTEYVIPLSLALRIEGDSAFRLYDASGTNITSGYTVSYNTKTVVFDNDTLGADYYVDIYTYDMYAIAADIWQQKAAHYADMSDWSSDNHSVKASQLYEQALQKVQFYRRFANIKLSRLMRYDTAT